VARRRTAIGDVEAAVKTGERIYVDNGNFDGKVEAVVARLGLIPGWIGNRPGVVCDSSTEDGAGSQQCRG